MKSNLKWYISATCILLSACGSGTNNTKDIDNDTIVDSRDNCPLDANKNQLDADNDGKGNVCDEDDDNDGFADNDDPSPLDASRPGDFSTPEAIINHPLMQKSLKDLENYNLSIETEKALIPPNLTGYYTLNNSHGVFLATSNGLDIGHRLTGEESRLTSKSGNLIDTASVFFTDSKEVGFTFKNGSFIRGENNEFTIYSKGKSTCTESNSNYSMYFVSIFSATLDTQTHDIINAKTLAVTVDTEGQLTNTCANRWAGEGEIKGGWTYYTYDITQHVNDVNNLKYMCVDENKAYVPTETWVNSTKGTCSCSKEYKVSCQ